MSYIGNTVENQNYVPAIDYFNGDGATVAFTLSRPVASVAQVQAVISNVPQNPGSAYTVSGSTITFTSAPPSGTANIYVYYTSPNTQVVQPGQGTVAPSSLSTGGPYWDTSGNVGVGTSSPSAKLNIDGAASDAVALFTNNGTLAAGGNGLRVGIDNSLNAYVNNAKAGPLVFSTSNAERMRIDSSGNVGIGTSSPSTKLHVQGGQVTDGGLTYNEQLTSTAAYNASPMAGTLVSLQYNSGAAYAGMGGWGIGKENATDGNYAGYMAFFTRANAGSTSERMRIDSSGNLLVGTTATVGTSAAGVTHIVSASSVYPPLVLRNGNATAGNYWKVGPDGSGNTFVLMNQSGTGVYIGSGSTSWTGTSDERLKDIIEPISDATNKVSQLRAVIGKFKEDEEGTRRSFLIAQDVQKVLPEAVSERDDELGTLGIAYTDVIPLLVAAIQELKAELDATKAEVAALKGAA